MIKASKLLNTLELLHKYSPFLGVIIIIFKKLHKDTITEKLGLEE